MYRKLVAISFPLFLLCIDSVHNLKAPRIVGGSPGYLPYAASIYHKNGFYVCGGTIISKSTIATSARCASLFLESELLVRSGTFHKDCAGSLTPVRMILRHKNFTVHSPDYDIGVLLLQGEVHKKSRAIKLAEKEVNDGEVLTVSGWGSTKENGTLSDDLNSVRMKKIGRGECQRFYDGKYQITPRMICGSSPGTGLCWGDVGGPVVSQDRLVGIVSFGMGCGKPGHPGVFTNVASDEIRKFLGNRLEMRGSTERAIGIEPKGISNA